jgi:hypothetical protein
MLLWTLLATLGAGEGTCAEGDTDCAHQNVNDGSISVTFTNAHTVPVELYFQDTLVSYLEVDESTTLQTYRGHRFSVYAKDMQKDLQDKEWLMEYFVETDNAEHRVCRRDAPLDR